MTIQCINVKYHCIIGMQQGDTVSVYADLDNKCRKGLTKPYLGKKLFIGNGYAMLSRSDIFCDNLNAR